MFGIGRITDPRIVAQVAEPKDGFDPVRDPASDAAAQDFSAGITAEISFDQGSGNAGQRGGFQGKRDHGHKPG